MSYNQKTGMYEGYIYKVTNKVNSHMYIGQTLRTINDRWKEHVKDAMRKADNYYFHSAIRLYKEDSFLVEQVEKLYSNSLNELKKILNNKERHYINIFNTYNPDGYNGAKGGEGASVRPIDYYSLDKILVKEFDSMTAASEFTNLSLATITANCQGISTGTKCGFFRYHGDSLDKFETLFRYNGAIAINKFNLDGELISSYKSSSEICKEYGITRRVALAWKDKHMLVDDEFVFFLETEEFDYKKITVPFISKINAFDLNMNYIGTFKSQSDAARVLNVDHSSISKCCLGKVSHVKDFIFKKVEWNI